MISALNIKTQMCGLVVLLLVTFFFARLPKISVRTTRMFRVMLIMAYLCDITDMISVGVTYNADRLSPDTVEFCGKLYLFFLISVIYCGLLYLFSDIYKEIEVFTTKTLLYSGLMIVSCALMAVLPIYFVCEDDGRNTYSYGPSTTVVYIAFAIFFVALLLHTLVNRASINPRRRTAIILWLGLWAASALAQLIISHLLVVSFAVCLGVLIIFCMIENPELNLSRSNNFFNIAGMVQYLFDLFGKKTPFYIINTGFQTEHIGYYEGAQKDAAVFVGSGEVYFIFTDRDKAGKYLVDYPRGLNKKRIYVIWDSSLLANTDELLYILREAKDSNKREHSGDIVVIDDKLKNEILEWEKTGIMIESAMRDDRIEVFYQPIYSVKEKRFCSAEALVRIREKDGVIVSPGKFIPVAEENKSILKLGKIVFDKVCDFLNREDTDALGLRYVEVNLSVVQAEDEALADDVIETMEKYSIESRRINLEITETASISGRTQLLKTMDTLQKRSVLFSLDDFGTGQSNLDYMASMPVHLVKFDREMTQRYFVSEKTRIIIDAAVTMIHEMGMKIVAEGIETVDELDSMEEIGIDYIQGFYFSKPLPEREFVEFLKVKNKVA